MKEEIKATGRVNYKLFSPSGELKEERDINNLVMTVGKNFLASWLATASQSTVFMPYVALGTGVTAASAGDTALQTELATRVAGTVTSSTNVYQNIASFGPGVDTGAVTEAGLLSAAAAGTLFARQVFSVINKGAGDTLQVTWQVTLS